MDVPMLRVWLSILHGRGSEATWAQNRETEDDMSEKLPKTLTVERCRCPCPNCSTYQFKEGLFYQGSGFSKEAAEEIAHRYNVHEELVDALKHLMRYDFGDSEGAKKARAAIAAAPRVFGCTVSGNHSWCPAMRTWKSTRPKPSRAAISRTAGTMFVATTPGLMSNAPVP